MKWIKVEDKLPVPCIDILFTDGKKWYKGWLDTYEPLEDPVFYNDESNKIGSDHWPENITHWAIPELPKE
jgi:hypothetical protein